MEHEEIIQKTGAFAKQKLSGESSGHDWWHVYRVWKTAVHIGAEEKADLFVVQLAALLHDIADWKFNAGDETAGPKLAEEWLNSLGVDKAIIKHVCEIIKDISFKGAGTQSLMKTKEGMAVQDADRLDGIGAMGISRTFAYGGHVKRAIHDPNMAPEHHKTAEEYKAHAGKGTSINHFHEKLLLLKDRMNTNAGKKIAEQRHKFTESFLKEFLQEWDGKA